jgi:hypothetical protein
MRRIYRAIALALVLGLAVIAAPAGHAPGTTSRSAPGVANPPSVAGIRWTRHGVTETAGIRWKNGPDPERQAALL